MCLAKASLEDIASLGHQFVQYFLVTCDFMVARPQPEVGHIDAKQLGNDGKRPIFFYLPSMCLHQYRL